MSGRWTQIRYRPWSVEAARGLPWFFPVPRRPIRPWSICSRRWLSFHGWTCPAPSTSWTVSHCTIDQIRSPYTSIRSLQLTIPSPEPLKHWFSFCLTVISQVQPFLLIKPVDPLLVDFPSFTQQQDMDPSISVSFPHKGDFFYLHMQYWLFVAGLPFLFTELSSIQI